MVAFEKIPEDWRKGQAVFNYLQWLRQNGHGESSEGRRIADPFHIPDNVWDEKYEEFLKYVEGGGRV